MSVCRNLKAEMKCPRCRSENRSATIESRPHGGATYRKRRCPDCDETFTTVERPAENTSVWSEIFKDLKLGKRVARKAVPKTISTSHLQHLLSPKNDIPDA
jgi:transcriptional regulator NrdR family protein